jgi:hypothetical protein
MSVTNQHPASGNWTYRSLLNNPDLKADFNALEFGRANLNIEIDGHNSISGKIYDTGWELALQGTFQPGSPATLKFQGSGMVGGSPWVYDYLAYLVPQSTNGVNQVPALVGSVTRAASHPDGQGGTGAAGVVCTFYAVRQ